MAKFRIEIIRPVTSWEAKKRTMNYVSIDINAETVENARFEASKYIMRQATQTSNSDDSIEYAATWKKAEITAIYQMVWGKEQ